MDDASKGPNKAIIGIIVVALLVAAATAVVVLTGNGASKETTNDSAITSPSVSTSPTANASSSSGSFKDGTYTATGSYQTPGGQESIVVRVTLAGDVVIDATVTKQGKTGEAQEFQGKFVSGFEAQVEGKKISEVSLSRVAGSSLTPIGFNNAIDEIEKQAHA